MRFGVLLGSIALIGASLPSTPAEAEPPNSRCADGWRFQPAKKRRLRQAVIETQRQVNATEDEAEATFTSKKSKTTRMSVGVNLEASYDAIFASVKASVDTKIEKESTAETGVEFEVKVPAGKSVAATYGPFVRPVTGRLTKGEKGSCKVNKRVTAYIPRGSGWRATIEES